MKPFLFISGSVIAALAFVLGLGVWAIVAGNDRQPSDVEARATLVADYRTPTPSPELVDLLRHPCFTEDELGQLRLKQSLVCQYTLGIGDMEEKAGELADQWLAGQKLPASLSLALRPSVTLYFLAATPEEKERAKTEMHHTVLLWVSANRAQSGVTYIGRPSSTSSDWRVRELESEVDRLRLCVNHGVGCY